MDLLQLATQLGPTAGVVIVVMMFLRYLSAARREARADAVRLQRVIDRNTRAFTRFLERTDRPACATSKPAAAPDLLKTLCQSSAG